MILLPDNIRFSHRARDYIQKNAFHIETDDLNNLQYVPTILYSYASVFLDSDGKYVETHRGYLLGRMRSDQLDNAVIVNFEQKKPVAIHFEFGYSAAREYFIDCLDGHIVIIEHNRHAKGKDLPAGAVKE